MKKAISFKLKTCALLFATMLATSAFIGCQDEVDESNRYTFTGEVISSHLQNNPDKYSHFVSILSKATLGNKAQSSLLETLSSYGAYTCFAPTNDAVERYVKEKYEIWATSVENNKQDASRYPIEETGVTSPYVEDLSIEKCNEIAKNHIIEDEFKLVDFGGELPKRSMSFRSITTKSNTFDSEGNRIFNVGAKDARVIEGDIATYNGTIHALENVLDPSTKNAADILNEADGVSIFREALIKTGLNKLLEKKDRDNEYDKDQTQPSLPDYTSGEDSRSYYPETSTYGFTLLIEPNEVLADPKNNSLGISITNIDRLIEFAEAVYGSDPEYKEVYNHPKNALFKYIAYHIIDRNMSKDIKGEEGGNATGNWFMYDYDRNEFKATVNMGNKYDWHDYFETYLPYSEWTYTEEEVKAVRNGDVEEGCMIKATQPKGNEYKVIINHCESPSHNMSFHTNIAVLSHDEAKAKWPETMQHILLEPTNGSIQYIDKILVYNEKEMTTNIINERMRWDSASLLPELTTNRVRWRADKKFFYIPAGKNGNAKERQFCKRLKSLSEETHVVYLRPSQTSNGSYTSYQGDELLMTNKFDAKLRIPHVPQGTYEIRIGFSMSKNRGVIQFYLDDEICGIPTDMRLNDVNKNRIGWFDDEGLSEDEIITRERAMRNRQYMKAPASIKVDNKELIDMRDCSNAMRRIIATNIELTPKKEGHWLRIKNVTQNSTETREYNQDYLEIVPKKIYGNPSIPEDKD